MINTLPTSTELNHLSQEELIRRTCNGETEAFNPLVRKYHQKIYNLIYRRIRNHETTEDLCQEVFLKAWQALPRFRHVSAFQNWLCKIAINCSLDFLRRQNSLTVFTCEELSLNTDDSPHTPMTYLSPDKLLENVELRDIIRDAVRQLSDGQHKVFCLRYRDGLSIKEIASHLEKSEGTIKTHLYHAHRKLRKILRPYLEEGELKQSGN